MMDKVAENLCVDLDGIPTLADILWALFGGIIIKLRLHIFVILLLLKGGSKNWRLVIFTLFRAVFSYFLRKIIDYLTQKKTENEPKEIKKSKRMYLATFIKPIFRTALKGKVFFYYNYSNVLLLGVLAIGYFIWNAWESDVTKARLLRHDSLVAQREGKLIALYTCVDKFKGESALI